MQKQSFSVVQADLEKPEKSQVLGDQGNPQHTEFLDSLPGKNISVIFFQYSLLNMLLQSDILVILIVRYTLYFFKIIIIIIIFC